MNSAATLPGLGPSRKVVWSLATLVVLSFLAGTVVVEFEFFPYPQFLKQAYRSLRYRLGQRDRDWTDDGRFRYSRTTATGVTQHTSDAYPGYTLYVSSRTSGATLVDMGGHETHRWHLPFYSIWSEPNHFDNMVSEEAIYTFHAHLETNGDLVLNYCASGVTPYGYGLVKLDKNSKLLWSYPGRVHHEFEVAPNGIIYALTHEYRTLTDADRPPQVKVDSVLEDFVVAVSPAGKELWKISLLDAAQCSPEYCSWAIAINDWDLMHANSVRVVPEEFARQHGFCRAGQLLISFRNPDTLAILDVERKRIVWATRGFWRQQHCPLFLPGGRMMIFDNQGFTCRGERLDVSRVVEFDPCTNQTFWEYRGSPAVPFYSKFRGYEQVLPNRNVLITESNEGRIFEVTPEKKIAWEFYTPDRTVYEGRECVWDIPFARRFGVDQCRFLQVAPGGE